MKTLCATAALALLAGPALATDEEMISFECPTGTVAHIDHDLAGDGERSVSAADRDHSEESQRGYTDPGDGERSVGAAGRDHAGTSQRDYTDPGAGERSVGGGRIVWCMPTSGQR